MLKYRYKYIYTNTNTDTNANTDTNKDTKRYKYKVAVVMTSSYLHCNAPRANMHCRQNAILAIFVTFAKEIIIIFASITIHHQV